MNYFNQYYFSEADQKQARREPISIRTIRPAVRATDESFRRSIRSILEQNKDDKKIGLLLSGGVDSSLLLGMLKSLSNKEIVCFTAMTETSDPDVSPSKEVARAFSVRWVKCRLAKADLPSKLAVLLPATKGGLYATAHDLAMDICLDHCKQEGINNLWMGSGLDMFFGGGVDPGLFKADTEHEFHNLFWRHSFNLLVNRFYNQGGTHLNSLAQKHGIKVIMPFENLDSILCARAVHASLFFKFNEDKYPVRLLAHRYGVPLHESRRRKDALQHSSGIFDILREHMYDTLPSIIHDAVNFNLTKAYFKNNPNTDLQLFLSLLCNIYSHSQLGDCDNAQPSDIVPEH